VSGKVTSVVPIGHTEGFLPLVALPDNVSKKLSLATLFSKKTTLKYYHNSKSQSICYNKNILGINL
jgi:hypothetical protein